MTDDYFLFLPNDLTNSFSDSFKEELKKQLHQRFYTMFGEHIVDKTFRFLLLVGAYKFVMPGPEGYAYSTELEMPIVDNGYVFLTTQLSIMHSPAHYTSICWTSPHFDDLLSIQTSDIIGKEVSFFWCSDFPKEEILQSIKDSQVPYKTRKRKETGYTFDVSYFLREFPDVAIFFDFKGVPDETVLSEIQKEVRNYGTSFMTVFVHDISISNDEYFICIDHNTIDHSNYSDSDFQKDVDNLDFLLQAINKNPLIKNLKHIRFV